LRRVLPACGCGPAALAAAPRPKGFRPAGRGRPLPGVGELPATPQLWLIPAPPRAMPRCARVSAPELGQARTAWRAEGVPLMIVKKVLTA